MPRYHQKTDYETASMLARIEAASPGVVQPYFDRFGVDELPIPRKAPGNDRKYQYWRLRALVGTETSGYVYRKAHTNADKGGYVHFLTDFGVFADEQPEGIYDAEGNRTDQQSNGRGRKKAE